MNSKGVLIADKSPKSRSFQAREQSRGSSKRNTEEAACRGPQRGGGRSMQHNRLLPGDCFFFFVGGGGGWVFSHKHRLLKLKF